jgi:ATP-dependent RNA helicase HelY
MKKNYSVRVGKRSQKKTPFLKIKPGADSRLKKIFATIGVPEKRPFIPDPYQLKAISAIDRGDCLVTAPTGAGKTWIAEQTIRKVFEKGGRAWYASPLKALSNSKYEEFSKIFGLNNLGILTGDRKENPDAPIIVGTTEILRNQLYDSMHHGEVLSTDFVVLDEAHFLGDEDRGVVWEEIMIYLPSRIPILMLSATIGNARQISNWLSSIRGRRCIVIEEKKRPVPLFPLFMHPSGTLFPLLSQAVGNSKKAFEQEGGCICIQYTTSFTCSTA